MKQTARIRVLGLLLIMTLVLSGCTVIGKTNHSDNDLSESQKITEAPVQTPVEAATPATEPTPPDTPTEAPAVPAPTETPSSLPPDASASIPTITKSPTGETVEAGASALFIAKSDDATRIEWHFVNPDRSQDLDYNEAAQVFTGLEIIDGDTENLILNNIPESLNGWSVYCHFSNAVGSADTDSAAITVTPVKAPEQAAFDYTGTFTEVRAGRGTMEISGTPSLYEVSVDWFEGSTEYITNFSGTFSDTGIMSYSNAVLTVRFEDGSHELRYTGGTGSLAYVDSGVVGVYWTDDQSEYDEDNFFFSKD